MIFIDACFGKNTPYTPIWIMRQAGRYLPEYLKIRKEAKSFLNLCHDPQKACEVTLQPINRFKMDAAILFSDILVVPNEMGMNLEFVKNSGPNFPTPIRTQKALDTLLDGKIVADKLTYVYKTISKVRSQLPANKALIGFAGSPWTIATYMIEGKSTKTYNICKKEVYANSKFMHNILKKLTTTIKHYLDNQIQAGVNAVMIFDSWALALEESKYFEFSWDYMVEISQYIKKKYPHIPVILFPKAVAGFLDKIYGDFDVFGVDWATPLKLAKEKLGHKYILQGNMEPTRLYDKQSTKESIENIINIMGKSKGHIFNLGHGILPDIKVENVDFLVNYVKEYSKR